jgi:hypothetical protein
MKRSRRTYAIASAHTQRGVVLMIALIVLVALTLAGLSMIRSTDTGVTIAGNLSFRQAASQALDAGIEAAVTALPADLNFSNNAVPGKYYPVSQPVDAVTGMPTGIDWNAASVVTGTAIPAGYTVRYIVERLCSQGMPAGVHPNDLGKWCNVETGAGMASNKSDLAADFGQIRKIHYHVTVKVDGPRNTESFARALISK